MPNLYANALKELKKYYREYVIKINELTKRKKIIVKKARQKVDQRAIARLKTQLMKK